MLLVLGDCFLHISLLSPHGLHLSKVLCHSVWALPSFIGRGYRDQDCVLPSLKDRSFSIFFIFLVFSSSFISLPISFLSFTCALERQSPTFLDQGLVSWKSFSMDRPFGVGMLVAGLPNSLFLLGFIRGFLRVIQVHYIYRALYFCYYVSSTSDHQAVDPRKLGPLPSRASG